MSCLRSLILSFIFILLTSSGLFSQQGYFPPPSGIDYHNDTLTIFPPDSLPGDPALLLGYNIYVDSLFYDDVQVENQTDTVDYIPDLSTLYPGNHEFCAKAVYNLWSSDPVCDSGLVVYGYELPFFEDWSSGNFTQNQWVTESGNWTVESEDGNPGPAAVFSGVPVQTNYEIPLESFAFRADSMQDIGLIWLYYDVRLQCINSTGQEKLITQYWNWTTKSWLTFNELSNQDGSFAWQNQSDRLWSANGKIFKIRYLATGINSADIISWSVDNIRIIRQCIPAHDLELTEHMEYNELNWIPPDVCCPPNFWTEWDDGQNSGNSIGTGSATEFDVAARWRSDQLYDHEGCLIEQVRFFPAEPQATYSVRIWTGDSAEVLLTDQPVANPVIAQWNTITLNPSVRIEAGQQLWAGYHITTTTGYPAGVDDGPAIDGNGNMIFWENHWQTLKQLNAGLDYNWNIGCYTVFNDGWPSFFVKIYRETNDGGFQYYDFVDNAAEYNDTSIILSDTYCYQVTFCSALYGDTCESVPTNIACESEFLETTDNSSAGAFTNYPNPAYSSITIQSAEPMEKIKIYSILGDLVIERNVGDNQYILDVSGMKSGVYFLEIEAGKVWIKKKVVILR
jgi:hypothetical protein